MYNSVRLLRTNVHMIDFGFFFRFFHSQIQNHLAKAKKKSEREKKPQKLSMLFESNL